MYIRIYVNIIYICLYETVRYSDNSMCHFLIPFQLQLSVFISYSTVS